MSFSSRKSSAAVAALCCAAGPGEGLHLRRVSKAGRPTELTKECLDILGLSAAEASLENVRKAYREKMRATHPDKNSNSDATQKTQKLSECMELFAPRQPMSFDSAPMPSRKELIYYIEQMIQLEQESKWSKDFTEFVYALLKNEKWFAKQQQKAAQSGTWYETVEEGLYFEVVLASYREWPHFQLLRHRFMIAKDQRTKAEKKVTELKLKEEAKRMRQGADSSYNQGELRRLRELRNSHVENVNAAKVKHSQYLNNIEKMENLLTGMDKKTQVEESNVVPRPKKSKFALLRNLISNLFVGCCRSSTAVEEEPSTSSSELDQAIANQKQVLEETRLQQHKIALVLHRASEALRLFDESSDLNRLVRLVKEEARDAQKKLHTPTQTEELAELLKNRDNAEIAVQRAWKQFNDCMSEPEDRSEPSSEAGSSIVTVSMLNVSSGASSDCASSMSTIPEGSQAFTQSLQAAWQKHGSESDWPGLEIAADVKEVLEGKVGDRNAIQVALDKFQDRHFFWHWHFVHELDFQYRNRQGQGTTAQK